MVTTDVLYEVWQDIVTRHVAGLSFTHETNVTKDQDAELAYPLAAWKLPTTMSVRVAEVNFDTFTLSIAFLDRTAADRDGVEMMRIHSRMNAIARQCWQKFHDDYLVSEGSWQGFDVPMEWLSDPVYTPIWDEGTMMRTGVALEVTVRASEVECVDTYFA